MPDMDGKEALQNLCHRPWGKKVVMSSSLGQQALITESMKIGAMGIILKPLKTSGMLDVIKKMVEPN